MNLLPLIIVSTVCLGLGTKQTGVNFKCNRKLLTSQVNVGVLLVLDLSMEAQISAMVQSASYQLRLISQLQC